MRRTIDERSRNNISSISFCFSPSAQSEQIPAFKFCIVHFVLHGILSGLCFDAFVTFAFSDDFVFVRESKVHFVHSVNCCDCFTVFLNGAKHESRSIEIAGCSRAN